MPNIIRFHVLDSFRGLCALSIILFHLHIQNSITEFLFFKNAHLFVEFFFVLSGFVLFHTYRNNLLTFYDCKKFIIKRFFRLYPLHIFMLSIFIIFEIGKWLAEIKGFNFNGHAFSGSNSPKEIIPNIFLLQAWINSADPLSFNGPSWSISAEFYVYILFAIILILFRKTSTYVFGLIGFLAFFVIYMDLDLKTSGLSVCSCFFSGVITYFIWNKISHFTLSKYNFSILESLALIGIPIILTSNYENKGIIASIWFCIVIITFSFEGGVFSKLLKNKVFTYLGKLSYSIYMIHLGVIFVFISLAMVISNISGINYAPMMKDPLTNELIRYVTLGSPISNNILVFGVLISTIIIAQFTWKYVEIRGMNLGAKFVGTIENTSHSTIII